MNLRPEDREKIDEFNSAKRSKILGGLGLGALAILPFGIFGTTFLGFLLGLLLIVAAGAVFFPALTSSLGITFPDYSPAQPEDIIALDEDTSLTSVQKDNLWTGLLIRY